MKNRKITKQAQKSWEYLVNHFTPDYIEKMEDPREYVLGFGPGNKSFCYLVEVATKELGEIRGANASKFGLWYGINGDDKEKKYRATKQYFNRDVNKAFKDIKCALASLIREAVGLSEFKEIKSIIGGMFKYKIMYLYNSKIMLPSFVLEDLQHFEDCLEMNISKTFEEAQKSIIEYKNLNHPHMSNHEFMNYLYSAFGRFNREIDEEADNQLNKKLLAFKEPNGEYITQPVQKVELKKIGKDGFYYPRDSHMAAIALKNADYKCENNLMHECFIRRRGGKPYTEVHHLIPLAYHYKFDTSLDIPENIVSLCSNCHNEIHYGKNADELIKKLFDERKEKLKQAGIEITIDKLLDMYHRIGEHK